MSHYFSNYDSLKFKERVGIFTADYSPNLLSRLSQEKRSKIGYVIVLKREQLLLMEKLKGSNIAASYVEILNSNFPVGVKPVSSNCVRIESSLRILCSKTKNKYKSLKGRTKSDYLGEKVKLIVYVQEIDETPSSNEVSSSELYKYLNVLQTQINKSSGDLKQMKDQLEVFRQVNQQLNNQIRQFTSEYQNTGKTLGKLKTTQKKIKTGHFREKLQKALWFSKSYGVTIDNVTYSDETGKVYKTSFQPVASSSYSDMNDEQKGKVKSLLYVLDKYNISDEAYHELSFQQDEMTKSYLVKECRYSVNERCNITATPGKLPGAQLNFKEELESIVENWNVDLQESPILKLKIAADGAKMSRVTNFLVLSLAVLNNGDNILSCQGQRTLAIINANESYESIKESLGDIFAEINTILETKDESGKSYFICQNGTKVYVEFFLGGDMKFLLLALGINAANSKYACLYCKVEKSLRYDMGKSSSFYVSPPLVRTLEEINRLSQKKSNNFGCIHPPLLNITLDHIIIDELHLMMRIGDLLIRNLLENAILKDTEDNIKRKSGETHKNRDEVVKMVNGCGVTFSLWETRTKDGKGDYLKNLDWTSLTGTDMKKVIDKLPTLLTDCSFINDIDKNDVINVWNGFKHLYSVINSLNPSNNDINDFHLNAKDWVLNFLSLGKKFEGYDNKSITPYIHILVYHVHDLLSKHGNIKQFSGQGLEKSNDDIKSIHHRKSNKHDAPAEALRLRKRKFLLREYERLKRKYRKSNNSFWYGGGKQKVLAKTKQKLITKNVVPKPL